LLAVQLGGNKNSEIILPVKTNKKGLIFLIKGIWSGDKYMTLKSCAAVVLLGTLVAAGFLIIRVVGEKRLERFLKMILFFRHKEPNQGLTAEVFIPDNRS
jgi:hypothetical protein